MAKRIDLTGKKFGKLEVIRYSHTDAHRNSFWECKCDCGNIVTVNSTKLRTGHTQSCGCLKHCKKGQGYKVDLTNRKFGKLTVVEFAYYKHGSYWKCKCDCGNEKIVLGTKLTNGYVKSCGCLIKEINHSKLEDLTGQKFGNLLVKSYDISTGKWHCICDCGNDCDIATASLKNGKTKSCGCLHKKITHELKFIDLTGKKFNKLFVKGLNRIDTRTYWNCVCECGREVVVEGSKLGITKSCGCIDISHCGSYDENEIISYIHRWFPALPLDLHDRTVLDGQEIDIYIPSLKVGIEYNGSAYHASENALYENKDKYYHRDKFLRAREKGIHLITVFDKDYTEHKWQILERIRHILQGKKQFFIPDNEIVITDNDYDIGTWLKTYNYEEVEQIEPESFTYDRNRLVYRCGKTKWIHKEEFINE